MTDDGRCITCTHYLPPDPENRRFMGAWEKEYGQCGVASSESGEPETPDSLAVAVDAEQYSGWLLVRPEFGCVQWLEGQPR